jgi:hypothetical protein
MISWRLPVRWIRKVVLFKRRERFSKEGSDVNNRLIREKSFGNFKSSSLAQSGV